MNRDESREVYVVSSVNHGEQEGVVAVFDTRGLADHFVEYSRRPSGSRYYIHTWKLNVIDWTPPELGGPR